MQWFTGKTEYPRFLRKNNFSAQRFSSYVNTLFLPLRYEFLSIDIFDLHISHMILQTKHLGTNNVWYVYVCSARTHYHWHAKEIFHMRRHLPLWLFLLLPIDCVFLYNAYANMINHSLQWRNVARLLDLLVLAIIGGLWKMVSMRRLCLCISLLRVMDFEGWEFGAAENENCTMCEDDALNIILYIRRSFKCALWIL